ncbi:MAG: hypothetical protein AUJ56_08340 [Zetaproteobacteria bacterium CG1_02_49_23]|nr:MAG: hypothetical protein AUJ56_08340 [Zetaproteobacteria bacterium CG1_02_49_23]
MKRHHYLKSPLRLFLIIVCIVFVAELLVMFMLRTLDLSVWYTDFIDAFSLIALLVPAIFFLLIRPLIDQNAAFEESESRLRSITSNIPDGMITIDDKGIIREANHATLTMFAYNSDELIGQNISCLMPSPYKEEHDGYLTRYLKTGEQRIIGHLREVEGRVKNGQAISIELQVAVIKTGKSHLFVGILRDISERKRLAEERRTMRLHLEHAQRLESLGVLAGGVAHDFNNILAAIMGNASLAKIHIEKNSLAFERLSQIEHSSFHAAELCKQMLAYAGKGQFVVQKCDLSKIIRGIESLIHSSKPARSQLLLKLTDDLPLIQADASQLQQMIMNLIINASEAIGDKADGYIRIETGIKQLNEHQASQCVGYQAVHGTKHSEEYQCISVTDNGGGIDPAIVEHIFEPFYSTRFTGRGLGLSACLGIARSLGGMIGVENHPGDSITMSILFPCQQLQPSVEPVPDFSGVARVLLADDDPASLREISALLQDLGLDVISVTDGQKAVDLFQMPQYISLVILNISLFKLTGIEVLHLIRQQQPQIKVILISRYNEANANSRLAQNEGAEFLLKPLSRQNIIQTLKKLLLTEQ